MTNIAPTVAANINRHHELACVCADEAINHAIEAGKLLLQVKADLPHGRFLPWLETNIGVSARQAQRYMAAAQGKPVPIRANTPRVSQLPCEADAPRLMPCAPGPALFVPEQGLCYCCPMDDGIVYLVEPASRHPGFFFVSRLNTDDTYDYTRRPIAAEWVEFNLQFYGLADPQSAPWRVKSSEGVQAACETLDGAGAAN